MINIDDVIKEVAKNLNLDKETVNTVCKHVFQETVNLMKSENTSDILFNELFKFKLKRRYKEDKQRQYSK
jgi:nucleoid DNA-binding protein